MLLGRQEKKYPRAERKTTCDKDKKKKKKINSVISKKCEIIFEGRLQE